MLILLTLCAALGGECHDERITLDAPPPTPQSCMMAQPQIAQWVDAHYPGHKVQRFDCVDPRRMEPHT